MQTKIITISEEDIRIAYKKTKYTLANDKNLVIADEIVKFEENFDANIQATLFAINNILSKNPDSWDCKSKKQTIWKYQMSMYPKSVDCSQDIQEETEHFFSNSPYHYQKDIENIEFREIADVSLPMHIFSTLWVMKIGEHLDRKLSKNIYCSRLYRTQDDDRSLNKKTNKLFYPYFDNYKNWRDKCFKKIKELHETTSIVAVTLDISNFYGSISLGYFTSIDFYKSFGLDILFNQNKELEDFHITFIQCLQQISNHLLIGLTCSPILANSRLYEWDNYVEKISPIYYGRYMDDILLVFSSYPNLKSSKDVLRFLLNQKLITHYKKSEKMFLRLRYNTGEIFELKKSKQKFFYFDKESDLSMLDAIEAEIDEISSEWNFIPDIASSSSSLYKKALGLCGDQHDFNNALRKVETITLKRLGLSLLISNALALNEYVAPKDWFDQRKKIYYLMINHLLIPENFFRNYDYVFRLFGLMISSGDFGIATNFLDNVNSLVKLWNPRDDERQEKNKNFQEYHKKKIREILVSSLNQHQSYDEKKIKKIIKSIDPDLTPNQIEEENIQFFLSDLCLKSFVSEAILIIRNKKKCKELYEKTRALIHCFYENFIKNKDDKEKIFSQIFYLNRRFTPLEISELMQEKYGEKENIAEITSQAIRLVCHDNYANQDTNQRIASIKNEKYVKSNTIKIAIANFEIPDMYWEQSIKNKPNRTIKRYNQLEEIINTAIKARPNYLIFPELAIPNDWANRLSKKLLQHGISFITGVEYIHDGMKLYNPVKMFLISDDLGYPYIKAFRQDKIEPAHEEADMIRNTCGYTVEPHSFYKEKKIYRHGDFFFSVLICNEFTDIGNRAKLRGNIDALFVVEWNKDIKSFNTYVESASLDIHCYVIQANNGQYGDSRIYAPYKEDYKRDIVRITGQGGHDVLIVGEIDIDKLRKFQSNYITHNKPFKPVPTGFEMNEERKKWNTSKDLETEINTKK